MQYAYLAITKDGKQKKGTMDVSTKEAVASALSRDGLTAVQITEAGAGNRAVSFHMGAKVGAQDLAVFLNQFQSILKAGVTIIQCLRMLADQTDNKYLKAAIMNSADLVERGESLSNAMRMDSDVYPSILINLVAAGEASGSLETSLGRMADHFEKQAHLKAMIKKAMTYPIVVMIVAVVVVIIMSVVVFPRYATLFAEIGSDLPLVTKAVMAFSDLLIKHGAVTAIVVIFAVVGIKAYAATDVGKHMFGKLSLKAPVFGPMNIKSQSASFARTMSTLVSSGMTIPEALGIVSKSMTNIWFEEALADAKGEVEQGVPLSEPLERSGMFPTMCIQMLKIGEETGAVETMLEKVAQYYEEQVEITTANLTTLMEPMIIVVLGGIVGVLVMAMYMPMINMMSGLENL